MFTFVIHTAHKIFVLTLYGSDESKLIDIIVERLVNEIHSDYSGQNFTFGPFGGEGENGWNSVDTKGIDGKWIVVNYGRFIESVTFEVDRNPRSRPQNDGKSLYKVKLEKDECITSFSGYLEKGKDDYIGINTLTFRTNQRILGPVNKTKLKGDHFSVPSKGGEVVKLYVRSENGCLTSIGARVKLNPKEPCPVSVHSMVLIGKKSGFRWDDGNQHADVTKIICTLNSSRGEQFIRSIAFEYKEQLGGTQRSETHGRKVGEEKIIEIKSHDRLTSIAGYYTDKGIKCLKFLLNKERIETIGDEDGIDKNESRVISLTEDDKIVGFCGWNHGRVCGIGAYFKPKPFGEGEAWEDKKFNGVREIRLFLHQGNIRGFEFVYDDGSEKGQTIIRRDITEQSFPPTKVQLKNYPREYLTSISGYIGKDDIIKSLTFYSNEGIYGPHGKEDGKGKYFWYPSTGSRITGFYGSKGNTLKSIGVYTEPIPYMYPSIIKGPYGGSGGDEWDDGLHTNVRAFRVIASDDEINSITFMYDDNGSLVEGSPHGGKDASSGTWIWLDFPYERLTLISVWGGSTGDKRIRGLLINTTRGNSTSYENYPYGKTDSKTLEKHMIKEGDHKIVGFFGREEKSHLISIGAHLEEK
ncbi:hypothetical protein BT93_G2383 [Corymbia citriodora subsp. variegata]|nr:hypothetical protein BT93_G2383 [Corymbia citriodora subsp. variegata]